jgi:hypothetical protein
MAPPFPNEEPLPKADIINYMRCERYMSVH